jgi:hypothetical protein
MAAALFVDMVGFYHHFSRAFIVQTASRQNPFVDEQIAEESGRWQ